MRPGKRLRAYAARVCSEKTMERLIELSRPARREKGLQPLLSGLWVRTSLRRTALAAWALATFGAFGTPSCHRTAPDQKPASESPADHAKP